MSVFGPVITGGTREVTRSSTRYSNRTGLAESAEPVRFLIVKNHNFASITYKEINIQKYIATLY
jgi:hypothetical protein